MSMKSPVDEDDKAEKSYVQEAASLSLANPDRAGKRNEQVDQASASPDKDRWATQRATEKPEDRVLNLKAQTWFDSLPQRLRPHNLAQRYPRICNRIVERWSYPDLMIRFFDNLLTDRRGGRRGFPMTIAVEIAGLKKHCQAIVSAKNDDVWNRAIASREF